LFVFFFSLAGVESAFTPAVKNLKILAIRVCVAGLRAHTYTYIYTHAGEKKREKEREREYERVREIIKERKEVFIKCYLLLFFIPHTTTKRTKNPKHTMSHFFFLFFFLRNTKGETHLFSLWILTHTHTPSYSLSLVL
tara:strand:+ start:1381 stop:1794 length:414 start_codon:yes stop_codon:yes gene_type:complete